MSELRCSISLIAEQFLSRVSMLMHAERDIVMANPSLCPYVCPPDSGIVSKHALIVELFPPSGRGMTLIFERYRR